MRNLTIHRTKSFVASLVTMMVYIEDSNSTDMVINDTPCRKLGELNNGESQTFLIGEEAAKVFVIVDKFSKSYCNEYYNLPAGNTDLTLRGRNHFSPASGNAFRFDGVTDPNVLKNRKQTKKRGIIMLITAILTAMVTGFFIGVIASSDTIKPYTFTKDEISITLTNEFREKNIDGFIAYYKTIDVSVFIRKVDFEEQPSLAQVTIAQYAQEMYDLNEHEASTGVHAENDLVFYEYQHSNHDDGINYYYFTYLYKSENAFWTVQFSVPQQEVENYRDTITKWAKSVEFSSAQK